MVSPKKDVVQPHKWEHACTYLTAFAFENKVVLGKESVCALPREHVALGWVKRIYARFGAQIRREDAQPELYLELPR